MVFEENMVVAERFELVRMIGRGGMGSVWEARDRRLSTLCAVKFIEGETAKLAEAHSRFQREAQAAAQLRSPHVVQVFDHGTWEGHPYIAMELLDGEDLAKRIEREEPGHLAAPFVVSVVSQLCRGLSRAHAAGIVHRDLKPDNVFIVNDDDRQIIKILDFGVAKSLHKSIEGSNTKSGAILGTPYYMSPEQAQGVKAIDARSDLWSVAVIVFYCMTGKLPFDSEALGDLFVKIIVQPIPLPSSIEPSLPASFDAWWQRATERDPEKRFQTAKELSEALGVALLGPGGATLTSSSPDVVLASTATPAVSVRAPLPTAGTFPGLDSSAPRKRGAPMTLFLAVGAIVVLVGLAAGGLVLRGRSNRAAALAAAPPGLVAEPMPPPVVAAPVAKAAESEPTPVPVVSAAAAVAPSVAVVHKAAQGKPVVPKPAPSATTVPGKEKPINLGF